MLRLYRCAAVALTIGLVASVSFADTRTVQFQDADGERLAYTDVILINEDGKTTFRGNPTGRFRIALQPGEEVIFATLSSTGIDEVAFKVPTSGRGLLTVSMNAARAFCDTATPVAIGSTTAFDTTGAGDPGELNAFCGTTLDSSTDGVWYSVIGNGNDLNASLCNGATGFDSKLAVHCNGCTTQTCLTGNDDFCGLQSEITWATEPGAEYLILVTGFLGASGTGELEVNDTGIASVTPEDCGGLATGGCCLFDSCEILTEDECNAAGGDYRGDDTDCAPIATGEELDVVTEPNVDIPDSPAPAITDTIEVTEDFIIADLDVDFITDHTFIGDLEIALTSPEGTTVFLTQGGGANMCSGNDGADVIFNDEGPDDFDDGAVCGGGVTSPVVGDGPPPNGNLLSDFDGENANGIWTMSIEDNAGGDVGIWQQWSLHFDIGQDQCNGACCTDGPGTQSDCVEGNRAECEQDDGLFVGGSCDDILDCVPLHAEFDVLEAVQTADGVAIRWVTTLELDSVGFQVIRENGGRAKSRTPIGTMVYALGEGTAGASYEVLDPTPGNNPRYFVIEYDAFGRATEHGPIVVQRPTRTAPTGRRTR